MLKIILILERDDNMKIGILTINDNDNYGNRLQNYAVQEVLKKNNCDVETIKNEPYTNTKSNFLLRVLKNLNYKGTYSTNFDRRTNFEKFNSNIVFSRKRITAYSKCNKNYDFVIVGSDQVWNPYFGRMRDVDLLSFVDDEKKISFAASFGVNEIPQKDKKRLADALHGFKKISVREDAGKEILKEVIDRNDVEVIVDPTMLIDANEWENIIRKPKHKIDFKYVLLYFLGNISKDKMDKIEKYAEDNNCKIINILDKNDVFYDSGPSEFLYLIKNSEMICTDSFHACVFSMIFEKAFVVFEREQNGIKSMNSRINTLLNKFDLNTHFYSAEKKLEEYNICDCENIRKKLQEEELKARNFIVDALDIK